MRIADRQTRLHLETSPRNDRGVRHSHRLDAKGRRSRPQPGDAKDLEGTGKIQHFHVVEKKNLHVPRWVHARHGAHSHVVHIPIRAPTCSMTSLVVLSIDEMCTAPPGRSTMLPGARYRALPPET